MKILFVVMMIVFASSARSEEIRTSVPNLATTIKFEQGHYFFNNGIKLREITEQAEHVLFVLDSSLDKRLGRLRAEYLIERLQNNKHSYVAYSESKTVKNVNDVDVYIFADMSSMKRKITALDAIGINN